jgi:hypothetical protein
MKQKEKSFYVMCQVARSEYEDALAANNISATRNPDDIWNEFDKKVCEIAHCQKFDIRLIGYLDQQMQKCFDLLRENFSGGVVSVNLDQFALPNFPPNVHFFEYASDVSMTKLACSQFGELVEAKF